MTGEADEGRGRRVVETNGDRFRAAVAWRGPASGRGLLYFVALEDGEPGDDRRDRRAPLEPDRGLEDFTEEELRELLSEGEPLTGTERRFRGPDGRLWLAQSVGPVWADEDPAEGSTGVLFTALEGPFERLRGPGAHAGALDGDELVALWRRAASPEDGGDADGPGRAAGDGAA